MNANYLSLFFWPIILSLIFVEYLLFRSYVIREIVDYYPMNFDQAGYLTQSYSLYENTIKQGLFAQIKNNLVGNATSYTFILQAVIAFLIFGASRLTALTLNFVYFVALQLAVVTVTRRLTQKSLFSFLSLGLILSLNSSFFWAGGLIDFRIDFMAFCLFGIFVSCLIGSKAFLSLKWTLLTILVATYLILLRYITATYIFGVLFLFLGFLIVNYANKSAEIDAVKIRIKHVCITILSIMTLIAPFLWNSRQLIFNYYIAGHFLTKEKNVRAAQEGVTNFISNISFYPLSLFKNHIGLKLAILMLMMLICAYILTKYRPKSHPAAGMTVKAITVSILLSIVVPLGVLTTDLSKSPVVISIVCIPILWLALWLTYCIYQRDPINRGLTVFLSLFTMLILSFGVIKYARFMRHTDEPKRHNSLVQISKMYDDIGSFLVKNNNGPNLYSSDHIRDFIIPQVLSALYYEKHGILLTVNASRLCGGIFAIEENEAIDDLKKSNVFITNLNSYVPIPGDYPFNIAITKIKPRLQKLAEKKLILLGDYYFYNSNFRVYVQSSHT